MDVEVLMWSWLIEVSWKPQSTLLFLFKYTRNFNWNITILKARLVNYHENVDDFIQGYLRIKINESGEELFFFGFLHGYFHILITLKIGSLVPYPIATSCDVHAASAILWLGNLQ